MDDYILPKSAVIMIWSLSGYYFILYAMLDTGMV